MSPAKKIVMERDHIIAWTFAAAALGAGEARLVGWRIRMA